MPQMTYTTQIMGEIVETLNATLNVWTPLRREDGDCAVETRQRLFALRDRLERELKQAAEERKENHESNPKVECKKLGVCSYEAPCAAYWPIWKHMSDNHGLTLLESECEDILQVAGKMLMRRLTTDTHAQAHPPRTL